MGRTILAVLAGIAVMWLTVSGIEFLSHALYPPSPGLDPTDQAALAKIIAASPPGALAMLVFAWVAGAFLGGLTAASISRLHKRAAAVAVALLVILGVCATVYLVPNQPIWVSALGLVLPIPTALLAVKSITRNQ